MYELTTRDHSCCNTFRRRIRIGGESFKGWVVEEGPWGQEGRRKTGMKKAKEEDNFKIKGVLTTSNIANVKKERIKMTPLHIGTRRLLLNFARSVLVEVGRSHFEDAWL